MTTGDDVQLVAFRLAGQEFAFNIFQVERILRHEAAAPLPKAPDFLEGVLQYQGAAVPLIDLRKRLSVAAPMREETRTVILESEGAKIGVVVDAVTEVLQVAASGDHAAVQGRQGIGGGVHQRACREGRSNDHCAQYRASS